MVRGKLDVIHLVDVGAIAHTLLVLVCVTHSDRCACACVGDRPAQRIEAGSLVTWHLPVDDMRDRHGGDGDNERISFLRIYYVVAMGGELLLWIEALAHL